MKDYLCFFASLFFIVSCTTDTVENSSAPDDFLLSSYSLTEPNNTSRPNIDSLYYENKRLVKLEEYVGNSQNALNLDYIYNFSYDKDGRLIQMIRIHSKSSTPSYVIDYSYDNNGMLTSRTKNTNDIISVTNYSYLDNMIIFNAEGTGEKRIHLNNKNQILSVEDYGGEETGFYTYKTYTYDENENVEKVSFLDRVGMTTLEYRFEYDDSPNPFRILDSLLPDGLSIKMLDDAEQNYGNYIEQPYSFSITNPWGYFSKNNMILCTETSTSTTEYRYDFRYNSENYPLTVEFKFWNNPTLELTYYR